jgi:origin recognition complex subunit 3
MSKSLNPSLRASIVAGILRPHDFTSNPRPKNPDTFPDTTLLFERYLESGKLINIYDWFESFKVALESQTQGNSPKKSRKGKKKGKEKDELELLGIQARFMRGLHELDYMGFIKHGGRKVEHITRTVFDEPDE